MGLPGAYMGSKMVGMDRHIDGWVDGQTEIPRVLHDSLALGGRCPKLTTNVISAFLVLDSILPHVRECS